MTKDYQLRGHSPKTKKLFKFGDEDTQVPEVNPFNPEKEQEAKSRSFGPKPEEARIPGNRLHPLVVH